MEALKKFGRRGRLSAVSILVGGTLFGSEVVFASELDQLKIAVDELKAGMKQQQENANHIWTMTAAALVMLMQVGFLFLEAGSVRSKNSINVAQKNVADFIISVSVFYLIGFSIMFGPSLLGFFGNPASLSAFNLMEDWSYTFFVFQAVFVGTAATIMSGAVAERMNFIGYAVMAALIAAVIYPVFGNWAWGNLLHGDNVAWLADMGFIDFAGSTVVHSVGAWVALAGILVLGPRVGRFSKDGDVNPIHGHSMVLTAAGAVILLVGWIGFNGGSTTTGSGDFARIVANTVIAAAIAGSVAMIAGRLYDGLYLPQRSINGLLAGLVGITAGCDAVDPYGAVAIGVACGFVVIASEEFILHKLKLDDVVGAVSVHGTCGALGTILLAFFAMPDKMAAAGVWSQFSVQCLGVAVAFLWTFPIAYIGFKVVDMIFVLRVSEEDELRGLNVSEHGASLGTGELQERLHRITAIERDLTARLDETTGDETAEIAMIVNPFLDEIHSLVSDLNKQSRQVANSASHLASLSKSSLSNSNEVASSSGAVNATSVELNKNSKELSEFMLTMNTESQDVLSETKAMSEEIGAVSQTIQELAQSVRSVGEDAAVANGIAERAENVVGTANTAVRSLAEASQDIENIVDLIDDIANKTNLLALNATIEASRAGEAGRGFAVVASEVKALSSQTSEATEEIRRRMEHMIKNSSSATDGMGNVRSTISQLRDAMQKINETTQEQSSTTSKIAQSTQNAAQNAGQVTATMSAMSDRVRQIDEVVGGVVENVSASGTEADRLSSVANEGLQNAERIDENAGDLGNVSENLKSAANRYKIAS